MSQDFITFLHREFLSPFSYSLKLSFCLLSVSLSLSLFDTYCGNKYCIPRHGSFLIQSSSVLVVFFLTNFYSHSFLSFSSFSFFLSPSCQRLHTMKSNIQSEVGRKRKESRVILWRSKRMERGLLSSEWIKSSYSLSFFFSLSLSLSLEGKMRQNDIEKENERKKYARRESELILANYKKMWVDQTFATTFSYF